MCKEFESLLQNYFCNQHNTNKWMKSNFLIMSPFHQNIVYRVFIVSKESSDGVHISIKIATCDTVKLFCKQNSNIEYSFQANVAARGYKVYKNITWEEINVEIKFWMTWKQMKKQQRLILIAVWLKLWLVDPNN